MQTVVIRNNTNEEKIWLKTFTANEEYTIPQDNSLGFKYSTLSSLLAAIAVGEASIGNGSTFFTDVNQQINWLKNLDTAPTDSDGSPLQRVKITNSGWHYQVHGVDFETSKLNSVFNLKIDGTSFNYCQIKFFESVNGVDSEITGGNLNQTYLDSNCIKTQVDWEPIHDYELIGGFFNQTQIPSDDVRLWLIGVPDIPEAYGGSKLFISNINLKYIGLESGVKVDGRSSKAVAYSATYHTNKMRLTLRHPAGYNHKCQILFEIFKP
jgi:hypothetical protein